MSGFFPDDTDFVTHEFVTPRYRPTSAPEYPNSRTAIQDTIPLASTISRLRLPEHSSPRLMPCFLQTLLANVTISTCRPESRRFFLTKSSRSDVTSCQPYPQALNGPTNDIGSSPSYLRQVLILTNLHDAKPQGRLISLTSACYNPYHKSTSPSRTLGTNVPYLRTYTHMDEL